MNVAPDFTFSKISIPCFEHASLFHQYISHADSRKEMKGEHKENISQLG